MSNVGGRRRATIAVAVVILVGSFGYLLWGGLDSNVVYFLTPQELLARGTDAYDVPVRLGGQVKPGTVQWDADKLELRFVMTDTAGPTINVLSTGAPPPMFRDGMGVVVEGRYRRDGTFASTNLIVKHSNEYRKPEDGHRPQEMYKSIMKGAGT